MKKTKKLLILLPVMTFLTAYSLVPERITVMQGEKPDFIWGMSVRAGTEETGCFDCRVRLFDIIPIKTVSVSVTPRLYVIPSGEAIGVKIHTDGLLVLETGEVKSGGKSCQPAKKAGIMPGDRIVGINGRAVGSADFFSRELEESGGAAQLDIVRGGGSLEITLNAPRSDESGSFKAGLWVRDSAAGIGTLTFYNPENSCFAALGHAICDSDTKDILAVSRGTVNACGIKSVVKGESGRPGELIGDFLQEELGEISENCALGIYGTAENPPDGELVPVASRFQVKEGKAQLLCDADGSGPAAYDIEITKISKSPHPSNKSFVIRVVDPRLLEKTGGIVQGMSGAPILQNGMLAGAVTHVFVNDPKRGYGVFAENMLDISMQGR